MLETEQKNDAVFTIADRVFEKLQKAIVEGCIASGSKISEPMLAKQFGISRAPLREALNRLEICSLVERKPNVGARVVSLSCQHLLEIYLIRESLEGLAAFLAAKNMQDSEIKDLEKLLEEHKKNINKSQTYHQKEGDMDFHFRIVKGSKNSHLINMFSNDLYHLIRLYRYQFGMVSKRISRAFIEHEQIVDAIRQRDGELAQFLMQKHIKSSRINAQETLDMHLAVLE